MKGLMKKVWSLMLIAALVVSMNGMADMGIGTKSVGSVEVRADETTEPTYDVAKDVLLYSNASLDVAASGNYSFGVTIPSTEEYYMSFTVKGTSNIYINLREGDSNGRLLLSPTQYGLLKFNCSDTGWSSNNKYVSGTTTLTTGMNVVVKSSGEKASVWINGACVLEDCPLLTTGTDAAPKISWSQEEANFTDIKIWQEGTAPIYDENDTLLYSKDELEVAAKGNYSFGVTIPSTEEYYMSFTVKGTSNIYINLREGDSNGRLLLSPTQYGLLKFNCSDTGWSSNNKWVSGTTTLTTGMNVAVKSSGEKASVWINGACVLEDCPLLITGTDAAPKISWSQEEANFTDIKIWKKRAAVSDEPAYSNTTDTLMASESLIELDAESNSFFDISIPSAKTYYMTMTIQSDDTVNIGFREGNNFLQMQKSGYTIRGTSNNDWVSATTGLNTGAKVTVCSASDKVSIWLNGNKIYDDLEMTNSDLNVKSGIFWSFKGGVVVTDAKVWVREKSPVATIDTTKVLSQNNSITLGNATYGYYSNGTMYKAGATVTVNSDMAFTSVNTLSVTVANGAGIKLDGEGTSGIRFQATVTSDNMDAVGSDAITEGMLITTNDIFEANDSVLDFTCINKKDYTLKNIVNNGWYNDVVGTYCGSIVKIVESNYIRNFIARAYVTVSYADGTTTTVYSNMSDIRNISWIAQKIQEAGYPGLAAYKSIIDEFAAAH